MNPATTAILLSLSLFIGLAACLDLGYRIGRRHTEKSGDSAHEGLGAIEASIFALLGLLLGFSFAGGMSRLDARRQMAVQEANAIGTAYLRLDLLPASEQLALRRLFRNYLESRLRVYEKLPDVKAAEAELARGVQLQREIWSRAVAASQSDTNPAAARLLLPAINEMIDITTARTVAMHIRLPWLIFGLLVCFALLSGLAAGYSMSKRKGRSWLHMLLYAMVISMTIYAVLDLESPRAGLIRVGAADNALIQLRDSIR